MRISARKLAAATLAATLRRTSAVPQRPSRGHGLLVVGRPLVLAHVIPAYGIMLSIVHVELEGLMF
eukprot:5604059-Prymnesium_polylepis.1